MEWLFFATMPSFMSLMSLAEKVEIFLLSGLGSALFALVVSAGLIVLDLTAVMLGLSAFTPYFATAIPSTVLSCLALLMMDNFTYTVFHFGISTSTGLWRGVYALLFIGLFGFIGYRMLGLFGLTSKPTPDPRLVNRLFHLSLALMIVSTGLALTRLDLAELRQTGSNADAGLASELPNIILLGSDGLNAENLSVYGYARNTTPQLLELAQSSLVAENAFTNAGNSAGSVISILTSKLPTQTRVLYPPDILTGVDSFQHLPAILHHLGYTTIEYGVPYYIDAYSYNLESGFDMANNRTLSAGKFGQLASELGFESEVYLLSRLTWRLSDRILHIFFIRTMENPFDIVTHPVRNISDKDKINQLLAQVDGVDGPVFIHAHLLGTHGGLYSPPNQYYSRGEIQTQPWMVDFYDDTLRAFDTYVGQVIAHLKETGEYANTVLIIYTDHNQQFKVNQRVPLIIHFTEDKYAGKITANVQNLDIAPTILDYLGQPKPDWMAGESLVKEGLPKDRLIFSMGTSEVKQNEKKINFLDPEANKPPFYQFSYVDIVDCQKWYNFDLNTYAWTSGDVAGYVEPCPAEKLRSFDEIKQALAGRLAADGFDISSLP
ncbi:MAG: sulfatase-like hydrolase/transferase [Acidobacteriaceae bacterium]